MPRRLAPRAAVVATFVALAVGPHAARAQNVPFSPYGLSAYREAPGFRLGDSPLVIHAGLSVEGGYDSNVFYLPTAAVGSGLLRLRLHVDLVPVSAGQSDGSPSTALPKLDFRASTQVEYREFLSSNEAVRAQRSLNFYFSGFLTVFPRGRFSLRLDDDLARTVDPRNNEGPNNFARVQNRAGISLIGRTVGGRLEIGFADSFSNLYYETSDLSFGNNIQNDARLYARFRLLPLTQLGLTARVGYVRYAEGPLLESVPVRVRAEASSAFARWFSLALALGYGNSLHLRNVRFSSAISQEELQFSLPKLIQISVGHERDFHDTLFGAYYVDDRIYLSYEQPFLSRLRAYLTGSVTFRKYDGLLDPARFQASAYTTPDRSDRLYELRAGLVVRALRWLVVGAHYNFLALDTDFAFVFADGTVRKPSYLKHSVLAQVDIAY